MGQIIVFQILEIEVVKLLSILTTLRLEINVWQRNCFFSVHCTHAKKNPTHRPPFF